MRSGPTISTRNSAAAVVVGTIRTGCDGSSSTDPSGNSTCTRPACAGSVVVGADPRSGAQLAAHAISASAARAAKELGGWRMRFLDALRPLDGAFSAHVAGVERRNRLEQ